MLLTFTEQAPYQKPRINLRELREVDTQHLPDLARRFACARELEREGAIIKAKYPSLAEEVDLLIAQELQRRSLAFMSRR